LPSAEDSHETTSILILLEVDVGTKEDFLFGDFGGKPERSSLTVVGTSTSPQVSVFRGDVDVPATFVSPLPVT